MHSIDVGRNHASPRKVNAVLVRGINDYEVEASLLRPETGVIMRFIEFMRSTRPLARALVVPAAEVHQRSTPLDAPADPPRAQRDAVSTDSTVVRPAKSGGGLIRPCTKPFCGHCSRIRSPPSGKLRTCLFSKDDSRPADLLSRGSPETIGTYISSIARKRGGASINEPVRYHPPAPCIHRRIVANELKYEKMSLQAGNRDH